MSAARPDIEGAATHRLHDPVDELAKTISMARALERKHQGSCRERQENKPCRIHDAPSPGGLRLVPGVRFLQPPTTAPPFYPAPWGTKSRLEAYLWARHFGGRSRLLRPRQTIASCQRGNVAKDVGCCRKIPSHHCRART